MTDSMTTSEKLKAELDRAFEYIDGYWPKQTNQKDAETNFIYECETLDDVIEHCREGQLDTQYALHRWYNYKASTHCENLFVEAGARKEINKKNKEIDIYINEIPFDVKLTVYPRTLSKKPYDLSTRIGKNQMASWMYKNQSQEQRKHLKNRIFIVCDGKDPKDSLHLKIDFDQIYEKIKYYMQNVQENGFNKITITDQNTDIEVLTDIIYIK